MTQGNAPLDGAASDAPHITLHLAPDGQPAGATAVMRIAAPAARVWEVVSDVGQYGGRIPMISRVKRDGDRVQVHLKFRITLFSVGFDFTADAAYEEGRWLELRWVAGEPRDLHLRFELAPGPSDTCQLQATIRFDIFSLGWLAKYFLRHHPEIQFGVFPGSALVLLDALRRAAESRR
jgi:ribosome-associated toxin RatA of RatAB toxin-antitoxin module